MKGASVGGDCARGTVCRAIFRAIAKKRYFASWDRESQAGERLRLAGYSSGRGDCARGGRSAGRCGSLAGTEPGARFSRGVLRSITPAVCRLSAKQDGLRYVAFLFRRGSRSPAARSRIVGAVIESGWFTSGLRVFWRRSRRKTRRTESAARQSAFCVNISALPCFPRGVRWGYAPQTAPKSLRLSGLSSCGLRRGCGKRSEGRSGAAETCQTPIYGLASRAAARSPLFVRTSELGHAKWKPHCGRAPKPAPKSHWLSGLSSFDSRCGCVSTGGR